ncbi:MAG: glycoside hydrolase family 57 protein [Terriglobales bacterium]|jgi:alpha-amylase/alpha-mannosidase (GH57 family)
MPDIRLVFLWHMHQPFYKDLVTGQYRLPWVRLHALKDYYGMVKLLDEFPDMRQTFNLVPSLVLQIEEYSGGLAHDPFFEVAAKPAADLSPEERRFALAYLFQANPSRMIARYPRYEELFLRFSGAGSNPDRALPRFNTQDLADLQVLSQLAWFDEFFLKEPEIAALATKGRGFTVHEQRQVMHWQHERLGRVLPAYAKAAQRGSIEISISPFYHPILPLLCDTDSGAASSPGLKLPQHRFCHPEDAQTQLLRGIDLHERVFGMRPRGAWPSEGSVSEAVLPITAGAGLDWLASDEGVLARSLNFAFARDHEGILDAHGADRLYRVYRRKIGERSISLLFRDRVLSDLIGFVYATVPAAEAASDFVRRVKTAAKPLLANGKSATISVILDGENAWEYFPESGREFLRRLYDAICRDAQIRTVTVSEAVACEQVASRLSRSAPARGSQLSARGENSTPQPVSVVADSQTRPDDWTLVPGSWINANFNVWIGAPEDNRAWDYLSAARDFYATFGMTATAEQRALAYEEVLIAEGSDWNWWYGPEHHSVNDRDFDELYRKHLSNIYLALGAQPPDYLAQPVASATDRPTFVAQTSYVHPRIGAQFERYFDWIGAAVYTSDRRAGAMHGKQFLLESVHAGIDANYLYGRLNFAVPPEGDFEIRVNFECKPAKDSKVFRSLTLEVSVKHPVIASWRLYGQDGKTILADSDGPNLDAAVALRQYFDFKLPLAILLGAPPGASAQVAGIVKLRIAIWRDRLPLDALPLGDWIELPIVPEEELAAGIQVYSPSS